MQSKRFLLSSSVVTILMLVTCLPSGANGVTLFQRLSNSSMVTQFTQLLQASGQGNQMNSAGPCIVGRCFLVFAPSDDAFSAAFRAEVGGYSVADKTKFAQHHFLTYVPGLGLDKALLSAWSRVGTPVGTDIGFGQVQILPTTSTTLYWLAKGTGATTSYRINNAAILVASSDKEGDNGVFHVLDQVVWPIGSKQTIDSFLGLPTSDPIINQLQVTKTLQYFNDWMNRDAEYLYLYNLIRSSSTYKVRTVFLPSDAAWQAIPTDVFSQLNSSVADYRKVLLSHFALDVCVFTSWMTLSSSIQFSTGHENLQKYPAKMYVDSTQQSFVSVGGVVAKFVDSKAINYPIGDSVIHVVDKVLNFAYNTLASLAQSNAPGFYAKCMGVPSCQALLTSTDTPRTLFAPNDVTSLNNVNTSMLEQILMLHFVPGVTGKPDMDTGDLLTAQNGAGIVRFRMALNKTRYYVEGRLPGRGFVRAELLMFDQSAINGSIFHKIAFPLGQPYRTVQDFINDFQDLSSVSPYMGSTGFDPNLGTATSVFTVFPPNNDAMAAFSASKGSNGAAVGRTILGSQSLRDRVFRRLVLPNQKIVADVPSPGAMDYPTANTAENEKVNLNLKGSSGYASRTVELTGSFVIANVNLTVGEYECTNGMVYPINVVLFRDSDIEGYARSGTALMSSITLAALTLILTCLAWL